MRFSLYRHSQNSVLAKFHFSNEEMFYLGQGLEFIPKLRVSGAIGDGILMWLEPKGNALRAISGQETVGVVMATAIKARQVSYPVRDIEPKRVLENGRNALRLPAIPELSESFNPPRVSSKDMEVRILPAAGATLAALATEHITRPPPTGEALMRAEERRLAMSREFDEQFRTKGPAERAAAPEAKRQPDEVKPSKPSWTPPQPETPVNGIADLVTAIAMVNEAAERAGPDVRLFVDGNKIRAKRERRTYEDL